MSALVSRTAEPKPGLFRFAILAVGWAVLLLKAGYITTTIEAGMVFLDWPLSNGSLNPEGWTRDPHMAAEHGHRLFGAVLGLFAITFVIWNHLREARRGVRLLAWGLLGMVILQGLLGGLRVMLDRLNLGTESNDVALTFAILHATGAQVTFGLLASHALLHSRFWINGALAFGPAFPATTLRLGLLATGVLIAQVALGAVVRQYNVGAAIHTFPMSTPQGDLLPTFWNWGVAWNFSHRVGALVATVALVAFLVSIWRHRVTREVLGRWAFVPAGLLVVQIALGWITTVTFINPHAATVHALVGAFLVVTTWTLAHATQRARHPVPASLH